MIIIVELIFLVFLAIPITSVYAIKSVWMLYFFRLPAGVVTVVIKISCFGAWYQFLKLQHTHTHTNND